MSASVLCLHSPMMDIWLKKRQVTRWYYCTVAWCKLRAGDGAGRCQEHGRWMRRSQEDAKKKVEYPNYVHTDNTPRGAQGQ